MSTITDARGAVSTFGYAGTNRGLVKTITHTLAGKPTVNIAFSYDAAGNRTLMTDQTGTSNYYYDELSRLTSESRTLAGTTYTLSYQYNLGDQVKKMTYPGNMSINYSYDGAGRLNGVTGSDTLYQGVSQYASGFSYRAWGAMRTMTDGANRTSTTTYDARLRPLTYEIDSGVVNQRYDYYNDGSMRFVHNASDSNFDRLYEYDQAGRLTLATTGGAARGDLGSIPYFETFGYNAWGDTTSRFTETWSQNDFGDAASFTNGRRDGWAYEADGNIKTIETRNYSYDAAGNRVSMTGQLWTGSNYVPTSTTNAYDGDGQRVEEVLSWPSPFTTRYLRSSVLGGEIAQEINSAGQTIKYVYLPDGTQLSTLIGFPKWRHETPAGTGLYENYQSGFVNRVEFDPVKANVGLTAPPPLDTNGGDGDIGGNHNGGPTDSRFSDISNPAAGCYDVGGAVLPCTWSIFDVLDTFVWTPARNPAATASPDAPPRRVPPKRLVPINVPNPFTRLLYPEDDSVPIGTNYIPEHWIYPPARFVNITIGQSSVAANPQNSTSPADFRRNTFNKFQADINRCIGEIFGKTAKKIPTQTLDIAPDLDVTVNGRELAKRSDMAGKLRSVIAIPDPKKGPHGTVFIQSGAWNLPGYPIDVLEGAYIHEYGNILSYKYGGGNSYKFGDKAGVGNVKDKDTGANFQRCVFPSSVKF